MFEIGKSTFLFRNLYISIRMSSKYSKTDDMGIE